MLSHLPVFIENPQRVLLRDLRNFSIQRDRYLLDRREIDFDEPARKPDRVGQRAFGGVWEIAVTRACEYVASLKPVYRTAGYARRADEHGIDSPRLYGYAVDDQGDKRCCSRCYAKRILPARLRRPGWPTLLKKFRRWPSIL